MKPSTLNIFQSYLDAALKAELGISIATSNVDSTKRYLYKAISLLKEKGLDQYAILKIVTPPNNSESSIWIIKKDTTND